MSALMKEKSEVVLRKRLTLAPLRQEHAAPLFELLNDWDVVRMLALGAHGVLLGRAFIYALAARGGLGVTQLLDLIEKDTSSPAIERMAA